LKSLESHFQSLANGKLPENLYQPVEYILTQGGKRLRPKLVILANELFGGDPKSVIHPAAAFEMLHNFTLIHDDIMDDAPIRRGKPTVYKQWNSNIAILSGDVLATMAFEELLKTPCSAATTIELSKLFVRTSIEICEGQQYDLDFETAKAITQAQYIEMIRLKTAVMLAGCLKAGALHAGAKAEDCDHIYQFGINMGIAFQLQDDILDIYGKEQEFGKIQGGDIKDNKKTYPYIIALEKADTAQKEQLIHYFSSTDFDVAEKFNAIKNIFNQLKVKELTMILMQSYIDASIEQLNQITTDSPIKSQLQELTLSLANRSR
jgi:geranylgeranyl diphosphate synthase type II